MAAAVPLLAGLAACTADKTPTRTPVTPTPSPAPTPTFAIDARLDYDIEKKLTDQCLYFQRHSKPSDLDDSIQVATFSALDANLTYPGVLTIKADQTTWKPVEGGENLTPPFDDSKDDKPWRQYTIADKAHNRTVMMQVDTARPNFPVLVFHFAVNSCRKFLFKTS